MAQATVMAKSISADADPLSQNGHDAATRRVLFGDDCSVFPCWSLFSNALSRGRTNRDTAFTENSIVGSDTDDDMTPSNSEQDEKSSFFTEDETDLLTRVYSRLCSRANNGGNIGPSVLFQLAEAAAEATLAAEERRLTEQHRNDNGNAQSGAEQRPSFSSFDGIPLRELEMERLLKMGKRMEALRQRKDQHLQRIRYLVEKCQRLLPDDWWNMVTSTLHQHQHHQQQLQEVYTDDSRPLKEDTSIAATSTNNNNYLDSKEQFLYILSVWLGRRGTNAELDCMLNFIANRKRVGNDRADEQAEQEAGGLVDLCYRWTLAQAVIGLQHPAAGAETTLQRTAETMPAFQDAIPNAAVRAMARSFVEFSARKRGNQLDVNNDSGDENLQAPSAGITNKNHHLLLEQGSFREWHDRNFPGLSSALSLLINDIIFPSFISTRGSGHDGILSTSLPTVGLLPKLVPGDADDSMLFSKHGAASPWLFGLICSMAKHHHKTVGGMWHRLYSFNDGVNFSSLEHNLTGYHGPTLFLVQASHGDNTDVTFGAFASQPWTKQTTPDYFGDDDCFLFQLEPHWKIFRTHRQHRGGTSSEQQGRHQHHSMPSAMSNYQYFYYKGNGNSYRPSPNTNAPKSNTFVEGIGLGGSKRQPRFFLSTCLDKCYAGSDDGTFEPGRLDWTNQSTDEGALQSQQLLDIHSLEVWGVGGDDALAARSKHRSIQDAHLQKARQVDKAAFLGDFRSGLIESKMFAFHEQIRNRDGGCLLDCDAGDGDDGEGDSNWQIGAPNRK